MLIERQAELDQLNALLDAAMLKRGELALISGEAGIGKTSLLRAFRESSLGTHKKLRWVSGGCEALFTPRTLGPIHDMATDLNLDVNGALTSESGLTVLYTQILKRFETGRPIVVVIEDLHWADHGTLDLIKYIARRISLLPVLLILTFRDNEVATDHPLTQLLGDLPSANTHRLALKPLSKTAVDELAKTTGRDGAALHKITNGNPFYVTELLSARTELGSVPASIKDAVALRVSHIDQAERTLLERLSVLPTAPRYELLEALLGADAMELISACIAKGFLVDTGASVRFRHELSRLAILERIIPARRRSYHKETMTALMSLKGTVPIDQIVHHASGAYESEIVLEYAPKAARAALTAGAHREAAAHYQSALRFVDSAEPQLAAELYEAWAYEATLSDRMDDEVLNARRHAITLWRALNRPDKVGQNLRHLSRLHWYRGESAEASRLNDQAIRILEMLPSSSEAAMAYSLRAQYHMLNDQMADAIKWGEMALKLEAEHPAPDVRMHALNNIGTAKVFRNNRDGIQHLDDSLSIALAHDFHEGAARAYNNLAEYAVEFRDFPLAEKTIEAGLAFDTEHDLDAWTHYLSGRFAQLRLDQGRFDDAIRIANGIVSLPSPTLVSQLPAKLVISKAKMRMGAPGHEHLMEAALADALATDELQYTVPARLTLIEWAWLTNSPARASEHMEKLNRLGVNDRHPWNMGARAVWADRFGRFDPEMMSEDMPVPHKLELAGDYSGASKAWLDLGLPYEAAMVKSRGAEKGDVKALYETFQSLNALLAQEHCLRLARSLGVDLDVTERRRGPYKAAKSHPLGLTAKEQTVLRYLQEGLSNRDIAEALNRSQRTVEHHVASILNKLNAPNRMAAILRVQREPWLLGDTSPD